MPLERKRLTAKKALIKDLTEGKYFQKEGFESNYILTPRGEKISRARVLGTVMAKFLTEDGNYGFLVIDDETGTIRGKLFKNTKLMIEIEVGNLVEVIGKVREYEDEIYITPEVIREIEDPNWVTLRMIEMVEKRNHSKEIKKKLQEIKKQTSDLEEIKKLAKKEDMDEELVESILEAEELFEEVSEEKEEEMKAVRDQVGVLIEKLDKGEGAPYNEIIKNSDLEERLVEEVINDFLSDGVCYEPRPGRIKRL